MRKIKVALLLVIILSSILRLCKLGEYPAINADEAAIGYNAYSLIQTGMDEHGNLWPINFQSFNDYKPGLYFYLVLPFVKVLGLNEWAVRIPSAILGVGSVFLIFLLARTVFKKDDLALLSSFLLAISPWHIHFSRGGWEVNTATFLLILGVYLFAKGIENLRFLVFAFLAFVLSMYTYHAARIIAPLLILGLSALHVNILKSRLRKVLLSAIPALMLIAPLLISMFDPASLSRAGGVSIFADPGPTLRAIEQRNKQADPNSIWVRLIYNRPINYSLKFLSNYFAHFSPSFLFLDGDVIQRNKIPGMGVLYFFDIILLPVGLVALLKRRESNILLCWLLIAPIPAALTFQSPHALRAQNMIIPLTVINALGLAYLMQALGRLDKYIAQMGYLTIVFLLLGNFAYYQYMYWYRLARDFPYSSQYGVQELVKYVQENQDMYKNIVTTTRYDQPYILFLFYMKYPPGKFQTEHALTPRDKYGFSTVERFDKYVFTSVDFDQIKLQYPGSLVAGTDEEIPAGADVIKRIYFPGGQIAFEIAKT